MGSDGFGPSGDGGFGGGAVPAGGHALPTRSAGSPESALVFGGDAERPGFELGTFETDDDDGEGADGPDGADGADGAGGGEITGPRLREYGGPARSGAAGPAGAAGQIGPGAVGGEWLAGAGFLGGERSAGAGPVGSEWRPGAGSASGESQAGAGLLGGERSPAAAPVGSEWRPGAGSASGELSAAASGSGGAISGAAGAAGQAPRGAFDRADAVAAGPDQPPPPTVGSGLAGSHVAAARALFGPQTVVEAVQVLAEHPDAVIIAGGTVAMPEITAGRRHPGTVLTLHRCAELRGWSTGSGEVLLHAGLTLAEMQQRDLRQQVPALNQAARTMGAPHIRAVATLGGNLVVGPSSADLPVVLAALGASVLVASADGVRTVSISDFYDRDGVPQLSSGELVVGARVPVVDGMQGFMKIGVRGGISRAILSIMLAVDPARRSATCVVGAMALAALPSGTGRGGLPTLLRADHADRWLAEQVDWEAGAIADPSVYETFGRLVADSLVYGDGGGTIGGGGDPYRRKAVEICARRALLRALPPLGWLDQVRELQKRADFQRAKQRVERAEQARNQDR
ncbi:molybdopterin dehydrogenase FAD-binding [Catenulispora acidiphila DSM 44928]|uniref:Molybdopterin dehydrogenase FAD-binding n=1 Tax=Catenulispora acidiphila (strain DSM 44928 / JCM 14897 / NBRC 102108 / NRRL B-24433 / ID139908) TaxID=479433 RepID=C7Q9Z9_CATAD|nr:FAD binding domain-containing protein [Catenulispora acidiphila]ACU70397.1 molybdopterin dehydrogenase FAD-binding [Catenulispora acidiphila DSM 44928]